MNDPILLTPGPLTTSARTKAAMLHDWGSWDAAFNALTASVCEDLLDIAHGSDTHACVPLQGSGTFAVEAALGTLVPRDGKVLVPDNGAYCRRMLRILEVIGRAGIPLELPEDRAADPDRIAGMLDEDPTITHVALVHCETGTGLLNPLEAIADRVASRGRHLIVDAMSSFGALPIDLRSTPVQALVSASGKCLEGVPGMGFVIAERESLRTSAGRCHSLALDLADQWRYLRESGQWRFTPPTHVVAALRAALDAYRREGGTTARLARYRANCRTLVNGMRSMGFEPFLDDTLQAPIIVTFHSPPDPAYAFAEFYRRMRERGFILYPGKLTRVDTFRIGCIGAIDPPQIEAMLEAVAATLRGMGVTRTGRRRTPAAS